MVPGVESRHDGGDNSRQEKLAAVSTLSDLPFYPVAALRFVGV